MRDNTIQLHIVMSTVATETAPSQSKATKPDFGQGRYSGLMHEVFDDSQTVFHLSAEKAEKLARSIATEIGAVMASSKVSIRLGKVSKENTLTIREAASIKGILVTPNIATLRALLYAGEAGKHGFSFGNTKWTPTEDLGKYISSL